MYDEIIDTYKCILSCRKKLPGMSLEDALNDSAVRGLERELAWIESHEIGIRVLDGSQREDDMSHPSGQD